MLSAFSLFLVSRCAGVQWSLEMEKAGGCIRCWAEEKPGWPGFSIVPVCERPPCASAALSPTLGVGLGQRRGKGALFQAGAGRAPSRRVKKGGPAQSGQRARRGSSSVRPGARRPMCVVVALEKTSLGVPQGQLFRGSNHARCLGKGELTFLSPSSAFFSRSGGQLYHLGRGLNAQRVVPRHPDTGQQATRLVAQCLLVRGPLGGRGWGKGAPPSAPSPSLFRSGIIVL